MIDFDFDYPLENTTETPREEIEKAINDLWDNRHFMAIPKLPAICFSGWTIDGVHTDDGHFYLVMNGNPSNHDRMIAVEAMEKVTRAAS